MQGRTSEAEGDKYLADAPQDYQVALLGTDMKRFTQMDESAFKQSCFLQPKRSSQKVSPARVEIIKAADRKEITGIVFHFPRKMGDGEPAVGEDEREIKFECKTGKTEIEAEFDLRRMVDKRDLDL